MADITKDAAEVGPEDPFEAARIQAEKDFENQQPAVFDAEPIVLSDEDADIQAENEAAARGSLLLQAEPVGDTDNNQTDTGPGPDGPDSGQTDPGAPSRAEVDSSTTFSDIARARNQQTVANQRGQVQNGDWRVRLTLAPNSQYLYNAMPPGILEPLQPTNGIIFPYTPTIDTNYKANYSTYDLTHSNYRGYFYQNSYVDAINLKCTFTAQSTADANYLLAVIHFLRSATKMFYGKDTERGSPPPLVFLTGFGQYQFNNHSCLISQFSYSLPSDVDYIRCQSNGNSGLNLSTQRNRTSVAIPGLGGSFAGLQRLASVFMPKGAKANPPAPAQLGTNQPTYVPTKMDISLSLFPVQSRQQVSKEFSVKEFANGNLLKGGFW